MRQIAKPERKRRATGALEIVGLGKFAGRYPAQLSGGQQQRVAVARALVHRPALLVADEPTGNLDSATGAQIIELLLAFNRRHRSTLVLVTHDEALAGRADRVVKLHDGRIANGAA